MARFVVATIEPGRIGLEGTLFENCPDAAAADAAIQRAVNNGLEWVRFEVTEYDFIRRNSST